MRKPPYLRKGERRQQCQALQQQLVPLPHPALVVASRAPLEAVWEPPPPPNVVVVAGQRRPDLEVAEETEGIRRSSHPKPGRDRSSSHPPSG
jgi:hypothetical protein